MLLMQPVSPHTYEHLSQHACSLPPALQLLSRYYSNKKLGEHLQDFVRRCGAIARLDTIGHSVKGVPLWVLEISDKPGQHEPEPNVKYVANIHGDEASGRYILPAGGHKVVRRLRHARANGFFPCLLRAAVHSM
jgi:hypothetical protein